MSSAFWKQVATLPYALAGNELELHLPLSSLGATRKKLEFKWADTAENITDAMSFYDQGDCAPNARFNYVYYLGTP